jgi:DNA polymerase-3 subunit delta'
MSLSDIFCQDIALSQLERAYRSGRLGHSYIFAGMEGVGKFTTAYELAKMLLCEDIREFEMGGEVFFDSCGDCRCCKLAAGGSHPDIIHIYKELIEHTRDGKHKKSPIDLPKDVIDEFLIDTVASRPSVGRMKVYIVSQSERLNAASQNALLKVLEEPPGHCMIILICTRVDSLLATTLSRCRVVNFSPVDTDKIESILLERGVEGERARYFAKSSYGSISEALEWSEVGEDGVDFYEVKEELVRRLVVCELGGCLEFAGWLCDWEAKLSDSVSSRRAGTSVKEIKRRCAARLVMVMVSVFSDSISLSLGLDGELVNSGQSSEIEVVSGRFSVLESSRIIEMLYGHIERIGRSVNDKLNFENILLKALDSDIMNVL